MYCKCLQGLWYYPFTLISAYFTSWGSLLCKEMLQGQSAEVILGILSLAFVVFPLGDTLAESRKNISNCKGTGRLHLKSLQSGHLLAYYVSCA